ncbi:MAG: HAD hydrolase family protein, partial [Clostridia bacterium]|nr:HAD hydrolase family protein [Clostridia bacterium]
MPDIRLIASDLDGTLLNSKKQLSDANAKALFDAAQRGIEIVPATGRFYGGMPACIRELPYVHYVITINGASVYDIKKGVSILTAEFSWEKAVGIMKILDGYPVIYDC